MSLSRRRLMFVFAALFAALFASQSAQAENQSPAQIAAALKEGGLVVYFRHGATTYPGVDKITWPRHRQRLLSEEGIEQSEIIGAAFAKMGIQVGEVIASPFARCRDMAEIAFGRVQEEMLLLGLLSDRAGRPDRVAYLEGKMSSATEPGKNRIIVSHTSNIAQVAGVRLAEGDGVVVRPTGDGFEILGTMTPEQWRDVAG